MLTSRMLAIAALLASACRALTPPQRAMLLDPGGWRYVSMTSENNGFPTQHSCFVPNQPSACTGNLILRPDGTFTRTISAEGKTETRKGRYTLDGDTLNFTDEFGNADGPYDVVVDTDNKALRITTVQAGVSFVSKLHLARDHQKAPAK